MESKLNYKSSIEFFLNFLHFQAGRNFDESMSMESLSNLCGALRNPEQKNLPAAKAPPKDFVLPKELDLRKKFPNCPSVSTITDQGNCGSCWVII